MVEWPILLPAASVYSGDLSYLALRFPSDQVVYFTTAEARARISELVRSGAIDSLEDKLRPRFDRLARDLRIGSTPA